MNAVPESSPHRQIFRYPLQHGGIQYIQHFIIRFSPHIFNERTKFFKPGAVFSLISLCHRDIYSKYRKYMEQNMGKFSFMLPVSFFIFRKPCYIGTANSSLSMPDSPLLQNRRPASAAPFYPYRPVRLQFIGKNFFNSCKYTDIRFILMDTIQHSILRRIHCCGIVITDNSDR